MKPGGRARGVYPTEPPCRNTLPIPDLGSPVLPQDLVPPIPIGSGSSTTEPVPSSASPAEMRLHQPCLLTAPFPGHSAISTQEFPLPGKTLSAPPTRCKTSGSHMTFQERTALLSPPLASIPLLLLLLVFQGQCCMDVLLPVFQGKCDLWMFFLLHADTDRLALKS